MASVAVLIPMGTRSDGAGPVLNTGGASESVTIKVLPSGVVAGTVQAQVSSDQTRWMDVGRPIDLSQEGDIPLDLPGSPDGYLRAIVTGFTGEGSVGVMVEFPD